MLFCVYVVVHGGSAPVKSRLLFGLYGGAPVNTRSLHDGYVSLRVSVIVGVVAQFANGGVKRWQRETK